MPDYAFPISNLKLPAQIRHALFCLLLLCVPPSALAEGSVRFKEDILPLFARQPMLERFVLATFDIPGSAEGVRVSQDAMPALAGTRIGPYSMPVLWKDQGNAVAVMLTIHTTQRFYDVNGQLLAGDLRKAVRIVEAVDAIELSAMPETQQK